MVLTSLVFTLAGSLVQQHSKVAFPSPRCAATLLHLYFPYNNDNGDSPSTGGSFADVFPTLCWRCAPICLPYSTVLLFLLQHDGESCLSPSFLWKYFTTRVHVGGLYCRVAPRKQHSVV